MLFVPPNTINVGRRKLEAITAYITPELKQVLEGWAEEEARSVSSLVTYLLNKAARDRLHTTTVPVITSAQGAPSDGQ